MGRPFTWVSLRRAVGLLALVCACRSLPAQMPNLDIRFYSASLSLPAVPDMALAMPARLSNEFIQSAYTHFENCEYQPFLKKVGDYRRGMSLSDWHFYDIVAKYADKMFPEAGPNFRVLFQWFILRKSGIDGRLSYTDSLLCLHAPSAEIEFGFYTIEQEGRRYLNLTAWRDRLKMDNVTAYVPETPPDGAVMELSMRLERIPHMLNPHTVERLIEFTHRGETMRVHVYLNNDYLRMMDDYPYYNQAHYFQIGLSPEAEASLLPQLRALIAGKDLRDQVALLLSFTRTSFFYLDDRSRYGREKPMTPEQTLYHSYSDCEDRSALFFYLTRKLLGLPAIVLDFDTHVGVAVAFPEDLAGEHFDYMGKKFMYCEPTGPQDVLQIGEMWPHVKSQKARVITAHFPN